MRKHQLAIGLSLIAGVCVVSNASAEEYRGTYAQQLACTPDVLRLCSREMPDVTRIVACLRQNEQQLGASCRSVFESNAEATGDDLAAKANGAVGNNDAVRPSSRP